MNKLMVFLILGMLLVSFFSVAIVLAENGNENDDGNGNGQDTCEVDADCDSDETCVDGKCEEAENDDEDENRRTTVTKEITRGNKTTFLPWQKRTEEDCPEGCKCRGAVSTCPAENGRVMTIEAGRSGNIITITKEKVEANTTLEIEQENEQDEQGKNKTKLKAKLSNGRKAEIKVMPDVASERALERLRLRVCSGENNCTIELKEVGKGEETQLAYELQAERHSRILYIFRKKMQVKGWVDAETGEVIKTGKPWWAFLAYEPGE